MKTRYKDVNNKESEGDTAAIEINANVFRLLAPIAAWHYKYAVDYTWTQ